ncbi:MAG: DUF3040 domain-containing protein [Bifidobacteriaceae bacterium]|nr:DUF3040 domain-containing protein [Bifidobacteriaceae bacterium]
MPLSEYEQRVLDQLEAQLVSEDPELGSRLAAVASPRRGRVALGVSGVVVGLAVLVLGMVVSQLWVSLIGFLLMFAGAYFAFSTPKTRGLPGSPGGVPGASKPPKPGLSDRFQRRIDGREDSL